MIFQSDDCKSFNQEQVIDLLVSLVAIDTKSEKSREVSTTPYQALNYMAWCFNGSEMMFDSDDDYIEYKFPDYLEESDLNYELHYL